VELCETTDNKLQRMIQARAPYSEALRNGEFAAMNRVRVEPSVAYIFEGGQIQIDARPRAAARPVSAHANKRNKWA
jgi:hypothetical protein